MASIFDNMTATLNEAFGETVTVYPGGAQQGTDVTGLLRNAPVEGSDDFDGAPVLASAWTLKLRPADATGLVKDDTVEGGGKTFKVLNSVDGGSPAGDGYMIFQLKRDRS